MFIQRPLLAKWLTTVLTRIWFLSCVSSNMFIYNPPSAKWMTTVVTSIWFLSCVTSNMYPQSPLFIKLLTTVVTRIWFLSCVSSNMCSQMLLIIVGKYATKFFSEYLYRYGFPQCVLLYDSSDYYSLSSQTLQNHLQC